MSPEIHQRVRQLFDEALEHTEPERIPFLQTACAGDSEVFGQVAQLLAAHVEAGRFLEEEPALPQRIGRYMITAELGRGSMGIVYKAIDPLIGREVAVKVIRLQALADGREAAYLRERLFREARSAGGLFHPGIVVILDVGQEGDLAFIAMEYVDGPSLSQVLAACSKMEWREGLQVLQQTAAALDFAHGKGVVHRDIKPANIMLQKGVTVKVADFGIAKITSSQRYTKTGVTMGTPHYMSPEQVDAKPLDGRSDQFSLAVVAFELLTGAEPFVADSFTALAHTIAYGPRPSACAANSDLPATVDQVFYGGLGKLPEERYANCREFVIALEQALTGATPVAVPPVPPAPQAQHRAGKLLRYVLAAGAAVVLLSAGGLGYLRLTRAPDPPPKVASPLAAPTITDFSADPQSIQAGEKAMLSWKVLGVTEVTIEPGIGKVQAAGQLPVKPAESNDYELTAMNATGTVYQKVSIEVKQSPLVLRLEGESALRRGQFDEGLESLVQAAALGDKLAMMELGDNYSKRLGGRNAKYSRAAYWYRKAAEAGDLDAMLFLGGFYETALGGGLPDREEAAKWYRRASNLGSADATYDLGRMYANPRGAHRDRRQACDLFQQAVRMGNKDALQEFARIGCR